MNCVSAILAHGLGGSVLGLLGFTPIDEVAARLRELPRVHVQTFAHDADDSMVRRAREYAGKCHIVMVAQSAGGNGVYRAATRLRDEFIPIALIVTFDPPDRSNFPLPCVPGNVEIGTNHFQTDEPLGQGRIRRCKNNVNSFVVENRKNYLWHIGMPRDTRLQNEILRDVRRLTGQRPRVEYPISSFKMAAAE